MDKQFCENCEYWERMFDKCENPEQRAGDADDYMSPPRHWCYLWQSADGQERERPTRDDMQEF